MDCLLQNLRTGETFALNPHRTLIGTAPHATIRTAGGGPFLAALAVSYPGCWAIYSLTDDAGTTYNREPFRVGQRATPQPGDVLAIGEERLRLLLPRKTARPESAALPACFAYIQDPDGTEECRAVDHDLLFGRLSLCHVRFADSRLSRISALLASHANRWYIHGLSKNPIARNRHLVPAYEPVDDGDELQIGPLSVRIELRPAGAAVQPIPAPARPPEPTPLLDASAMTETVDPSDPDAKPMHAALITSALRLEQWLKAQRPTGNAPSGLSGWIGAQRDRLKRFWLDTPETTAARSLISAGKHEDAFEVLDRAIRARPESPDLLRELYRLYDSLGLHDLGFRPLRQIEKLAAARGGTDPWVLESLARLCERLSKDRAAMFDRAIGYWNKLEAATGVSYSRERAAASASRALRDGGFTSANRENADRDGP